MSQQVFMRARPARRPRMVLVPRNAFLSDTIMTPAPPVLNGGAEAVYYPLDADGKGGRVFQTGKPRGGWQVIDRPSSYWVDKSGIVPALPAAVPVSRARRGLRNRPGGLPGPVANPNAGVMDIARANEAKNAAAAAAVAVAPAAAPASSGSISDWIANNTGTALLLGGGVAVLLWVMLKK